MDGSCYAKINLRKDWIPSLFSFPSGLHANRASGNAAAAAAAAAAVAAVAAVACSRKSSSSNNK